MFLTPTVALAKQQHEQFKKYLGGYPSECLHGKREDEISPSALLRQSTIVVGTPHFLLETLAKEDSPSLSTFSMLVLDECHHTAKEHAYRKIMNLYLDLKEDNATNAMPQVMKHVVKA